jgi:hypothetical protein
VLGVPDDPKLPPDSVDAVVMLKTYYEIAHPQLLLRNLIPAQRPSGTVADGTLGLEHQRLKGHHLRSGSGDGQIRWHASKLHRFGSVDLILSPKELQRSCTGFAGILMYARSSEAQLSLLRPAVPG